MITKYLIGKDGAAPIVVRIARGAAEVAVLAALGFIGVEASALDWGELAPFMPLAFFGLQFVEGLADQFIDPTQNRAADK